MEPGIPKAWHRAGPVWLGLALALPSAWTAPAAAPDFEARSVALRTTLHHDAMLEQPFRELADLYRQAGRGEELRGIYETHLAQFPADEGARCVLLRLDLAEDRPGVAAWTREAVAAHPGNAAFHYLLHRAEGSLEPLARAVGLETRPERRMRWLEELLAGTLDEAERELAATCLAGERDRRLAEDPESLPELITLMQRHGYTALGQESIDLLDSVPVSPDGGIDLALLAARLAADSGEAPLGSARLGQLLERLTPDHPRRTEVVLAWRKLQSLPGALAAEAAAAWEADRLSVAKAVDLATILEADGRLDEAGKILVEAAVAQPHLAFLEDRVRSALEGNPAAWRDFVAGRVRLFPERTDLRRELVILDFLLDGVEPGKASLQTALETVDAGERVPFLLRLGEDLLSRGLPEAAAACFGFGEPGSFAMRAGLIRALAGTGDTRGLAEAVDALPLEEIDPAEWIALALFLDAQSFEEESRKLLQRGATMRADHFAAGLALAKAGGAGTESRTWLEEARRREPTGSDYREWLVAAAEVAAARGESEVHWDREEARLLESLRSGDASAVDRIGIFAGVAVSRSQGDRVRRLVTGVSEHRGAEALRVSPELRRLAVEAWAEDPAKAGEAERHLLEWEGEGSAGSGEARVRLALLYERWNRPDLATARLEGMDWATVDDPELLASARSVCDALELGRAGRAVRGRLHALRPGDVAAAEDWLNALLIDGDEAGFRAAVREILRPDSSLALSEEARESLRERVADSWREEIGTEFFLGSLGRVTRQLREFSLVEPDSRLRLWRRWYWVRLAEAQGRPQDAEALWKELLEDSQARTDTARGLSVDFAALGKWSNSGIGRAVTEQPRIGPPDRVGWTFQAGVGRRIDAVEAQGGVVVALDDRRSLVALDVATGKLRWRREFTGTWTPDPPGPREEGLASATPPGGEGDVLVPPDLVAGGGLVFLGVDGRVVAVRAENGATAWEAGGDGEPVRRSASGVPSPVRLGLAGEDLVVALFPRTGQLAAFDRATGKTRWRVPLERNPGDLPPSVWGFAVDHRVIAIFDGALSLHDARTGERLWLRRATADGPVRLSDAVQRSAAPVPARHVALHGDRVVAMEGDRVEITGLDFPLASRSVALSGIHLGGDERRACFGTREGIAVLDLFTGAVEVRAGGGSRRERSFLAGNDVVSVRADGIRARHLSTGRLLWETSLPLALAGEAGPGVEPGMSWRGWIVPERWHGVALRRVRPILDTVAGDGLAVLVGDGQIVWMTGEVEP